MSQPQSPRKQHCAVLAFPFGGHARPLLGLVFRLARSLMRDAQFCFFSTAKSNRSIFSEVGNDIPDNIKPYDVADGAPPNYAFSGNPHEPADLFLKAMPGNYRDAMDLAVAETGMRISSIIADAFLWFTGELADEMQVPWALIWISIPHSLYVYRDISRIQRVWSASGTAIGAIDKEPDDQVVPGVPAIRIKDLPEGVVDPGDLGESILVRILNNCGVLMPRASAIIINFYHELDPTPLTNILRLDLPNLLFLGFLTLSLPPSQQLLDSDISTNCISWLDKQEERSVAYIGFGTVAVLPQDELHALAEALEEINIAFIWSLADHVKEKLPDGFLKRTSTRGLVISWAPQTEVLKHSSTGVFVTHCGSNSVYESIGNGVPMICRPFFGDHRMIGRMVEEVWEIGVTVEGGRITKNGVLKCLELVLADEAGKVMSDKALALKELVKVAAGPSGRADEDIRTLVEIISGSRERDILTIN